MSVDECFSSCILDERQALAASFYFELSSLLCAVISESVGHCGGSRSVKPSK